MQLAEHAAGALPTGRLTGRRGEVLLDDRPHGTTASATVATRAAGRRHLLGRACPAGNSLLDGGARRSRAEAHVHQCFPLIAGGVPADLLVQTNLS